MTNQRLTNMALCLALGELLFGCKPERSAESPPRDRVACVVGDVTYQVGDSWPAADGCNTCSCDEYGSMACTEMACATAPQDAAAQQAPTVSHYPSASEEPTPSQDEPPSGPRPVGYGPPESAPLSQGPCPPGQFWKVDHCVGPYVTPPPSPPVCRPGATKKADCNSCHCDKSGHWVCTMIGCQTRPLGVRNPTLPHKDLRIEVRHAAHTSWTTRSAALVSTGTGDDAAAHPMKARGLVNQFRKLSTLLLPQIIGSGAA
jgi:hypothetical protein